jgi:hypothetical protein
MIQMAECDIFLSIFTRMGMTGTLLNNKKKYYFDTLLRSHLSNAAYALDNISVVICILYYEWEEW